MCGIAGVFGFEPQRIDTMLDAMATRGPDARGVTRIPHRNAALGHVRLSILDLDPRSNQPFASPCQRYWLCFNGEIYNYLELRRRLVREAKIEFQTCSDTEVLLHWLIQHGEAGLAELEGMFALALHDRRTDRLLLARDHIGEKPLYYADNLRAVQDAFAFASEIQALKLLPCVDTSIDPVALADYLRFLYVPHPRTMHRGIRELPPGSFMVRDHDQLQPAKSFYCVESRVQARIVGQSQSESYQAAVEQFRESFLRSVKLRLQSDVPVGLFLSGGLDSNAILAAANTLGAADTMHAFTAAYDQTGPADGDESELAEASARHFQIAHAKTEFSLGDSIEATAEQTLQLFGQPYGNATALAANEISRLAAQQTRVCLVGDGGDELLNGYPRHQILPWLQRYGSILRPLAGLTRKGASLAPSTGRFAVQVDRVKRLSQTIGLSLGESFLQWTTYLPANTIEQASGLRCTSGFYERLLETFQRNEQRPMLAASLVDLQSFVPCKLTACADRAGMRHSLELRSPFLAPPLIEQTLALPEAYKRKRSTVKPLLADAFVNEIPARIRRQPKRPFNPPMRRFVRQHMAQLRGRLTRRGGSIQDLLGTSFLSQRIDQFETGQRDHSTLLWGLLVLDEWLEHHAAATPKAVA